LNGWIFYSVTDWFFSLSFVFDETQCTIFLQTIDCDE
jgi:hypothetical protein